MLRKVLIVLTTLSFGGILLIINLTTPSSAGPLGVLSVFILAYIFFIGLSGLLIYFLSRLISHISILVKTRHPIKEISLKRALYFGIVVALAPIILIGLQSVDSSNVYSFSLVIIFVAVGCLYVSKTTS